MLVPQRLSGFEREGDALLGFAFAAEGEKSLEFEVKQILLADEVPAVTRPPARM